MISLFLLAFLLYAGGRPSRGTSRDKRLKENKPVKPKSATKVTPRKGGMSRAD